MVQAAAAPVMPDYTQVPEDVLSSQISSVIGDRFIQKCGSTEREREETNLTEAANLDHLSGLKFVGLFFSADWCPPCKHMLQPLKNFYTDVNLEERTLELILISSDRSQEEWKRHHSTMPWMTIPWDDPRNNQLRGKFEVQGVPALVILDAVTGFTVTATARKDLGRDVAEVYETWSKLLDLKKDGAVKRAQEDAIAKQQKLEHEWTEK